MAEDFKVDYEAVKKRAQREEWLTTNKLEALLAERRAKEVNHAENVNSSLNVPKGSEMTSESIEARLAAYHTRNKLGLAKAAGKGIETALAKMDSGEIEVSSLQDLQTIANIARIAWGGDTAQAVQVNILNDSACSVEHGDFPVFEVE